MLVSLTIGGKALIGNCFYPVIECHLPKHFHYRYTFRYIATMMGVSYNGSVEGTEYVEIYTKHKKSRVNFTTKLAGGGEQMFICNNAYSQTHTQATSQSA